MDKNSSKDRRYIEIFLSPLRECLNYKPKFGHSSSSGFTLEQFIDLYQQDPFYNWIGLDSPYMFAAHKAAGGMTSIYRQIGIGCERLFRAILVDALGYTNEDEATWSYTTKTKAHKDKTLYLDGFINLDYISNTEVRSRVINWMNKFSSTHGLSRKKFRGIVFEIRQGYKSKDSKRQNADIDNATVAYANELIPVFAIFSTQIDEDIVLRYTNNKCGVLIGSLSRNPFVSIFAFCEEIINYDLADFFQRNSTQIKKDTQSILKALLSV